MNRRRELGAVRCRGRVLCHGCQGVCLVFFFFSVCMHVCTRGCVRSTLSTQGEEVDYEGKLMKRKNRWVC